MECVNSVIDKQETDIRHQASDEMNALSNENDVYRTGYHKNHRRRERLTHLS